MDSMPKYIRSRSVISKDQDDQLNEHPSQPSSSPGASNALQVSTSQLINSRAAISAYLGVSGNQTIDNLTALFDSFDLEDEILNTPLGLLSILPHADPELWEQPLKSFTCFNDFPLELREQVWRCNLPRSRFLAFPCGRSNVGNPTSGTLPVALHVCRESRRLTLETYHIINVTRPDCERGSDCDIKLWNGLHFREWVSSDQSEVSSVISGMMCIAPSKDLLHLDYLELRSLGNTVTADVLSKNHPQFMRSIRYLELRNVFWPSPSRLSHFFIWTRWLHSLKELYITVTENRRLEKEQRRKVLEGMLERVKKTVEELHAVFAKLQNEDPTRTIPKISLHHPRKREARCEDGNGGDAQEGAFDLPDEARGGNAGDTQEILPDF